jgi:hypothetical protein
MFRLAAEPKSAQAQLVKQLKALQAENARLREDLAFFENLAHAAGEDKLAVSGFKVEADLVPGEYRYRVLVTLGGRKEREFSGRLQFVVDMQLEGRDVTLMVPPEDKPEDAAYRVRSGPYRKYTWSRRWMLRTQPSAAQRKPIWRWPVAGLRKATVRFQLTSLSGVSSKM